MLSNTSRYAIRAVIYLALHQNDQDKIGIKEISKELNIPNPFLGKILQSLAKHKLLNSTKGPHGGFSLAKDANEISLMDIIEIIDGVDSFNNCVLGLFTCTLEQQHCPIHDEFAMAREGFKQLFQNEFIGKLAERMKSSKAPLAL